MVCTVDLFDALVDLAVGDECGGCGRPGLPWCRRCERRIHDVPVLVRPRVSVGVPVWALGRYRQPHARAIVELKEHGRRDLAEPIGRALADGVRTLAGWGELPDADRLHLIPAPTRAIPARRRGGDTVTAFAGVAADRLGPGVCVTPMLRTSGITRDSMGLDARARASNMAGSIRLRRRAAISDGTSILVDDVMTTGATAAESVKVLARVGVSVACVVVVAGV